MRERGPGLTLSVRLLERRLLAGRPLREVARDLRMTPAQARLLEGHLVRELERETLRVRSLEAWSAAGEA